MTLRENEKHKERFKSSLKEFVKQLKSFVSTETGDWTIKGFIDVYKNVYAISSDTKIISKILEIHLLPELLQYSEQNNYKLVLAEHQNWYPDITVIDKSNSKIKFALDLKTSYRKNNGIAGFTLGSHGTYFTKRDKAKNTQYPYNQYLGHFCLGIIYSRTDLESELKRNKTCKTKEQTKDNESSKCLGTASKVNTIDNLKSIVSVIKDFDFFVAEKWRIASDKRGSGNTANIGSIKNIEDLKAGRGVFSELGEEWFDDYWMNYGKITMKKGNKQVIINNIWDFLEFKGRKDLFSKVVTTAQKVGNKK